MCHLVHCRWLVRFSGKWAWVRLFSVLSTVPVLLCVHVSRLLQSCVWCHIGKNCKRCCMARNDVSNTIANWPTFARRRWAATIHRTRATSHHARCCSCHNLRCLSVMTSRGRWQHCWAMQLVWRCHQASFVRITEDFAFCHRLTSVLYGEKYSAVVVSYQTLTIVCVRVGFLPTFNLLDIAAWSSWMSVWDIDMCSCPVLVTSHTPCPTKKCTSKRSAASSYTNGIQ